MYVASSLDLVYYIVWTVHEEQSIDSAGLLQGMRLVLEPGAAPLGTQMTLTFTPPAGDPGSEQCHLEVMVDMKLTVQDCLTLMRNKAQLTGKATTITTRCHGYINHHQVSW